MRVLEVFAISLACFVAVNQAHPAKPQDEVEIVPLDDPYGGQAVVDTGIFGGPVFYSPFDGLLGSLSGALARMRAQMNYILSRLPSLGNSTFSEDSLFPGIPKIDLSKGNTTSVTKVINGHKVVINETEFKQESENGGALFKVKIIDFQPDNSGLTTDKNAEEITPETTRDIEDAENSFENEIPKNRESKDTSNLETFDVDVDVVDHPRVIQRQNFKKWDTIEPLESFEDNAVDSDDERLPVDLNRDIYVNKIMADAGATADPDAEVFSNDEVKHPRYFEKLMDPR